MSADEFRAWQQAMGISGAEAGRRLGVHANTIARYRQEGGPRMLRLACLALFHKLEDEAF